MSSSTSSSDKASCLLLLAVGMAAMLLVAAAFSEWLLRARVVPEDMFWRQVDLFHSATTPDAAFGDSHLSGDFAGSKNFVNLAYPGDALPQMTIKAKAYYAARKPGRVIVQASPHMFSSVRLEAEPRDSRRIFAEGQKRYAPFRLHILDGYYRTRLFRYLRLLLFPEKDTSKRTFFLSSGAIVSDWDIAELSRSADWEAAKIRMQAGVKERIPLKNPENSATAAGLDALLAWLKDKGAETCLVTPPVSRVYRELSAKLGGQERIEDTLALFPLLAAENNARYVSYWNKVDDYALYINSDHLNRKGAEMLTPRIMKDCFGMKPARLMKTKPVKRAPKRKKR